MRQVLLRRNSKDLYQVSIGFREGLHSLLRFFCRCKRVELVLADSDELIINKGGPYVAEGKTLVLCSTNIEPGLITVRVGALHFHVDDEDTNIASLRETLSRSQLLSSSRHAARCKSSLPETSYDHGPPPAEILLVVV
jgi:hypothetical protein